MKKAYYKSKIGILEIKVEDDYLTGLNFLDGNIKLEQEDKSEFLDKIKKELNEYFTGKRKKFEIKTKIKGTDFQKRVWQELCNIPYGEFVSYKYIAEKLGSPKACRAVGGANNKNNISIVIPCHRVIGANGKLIGYGSGLWRKEFLINLELKNQKH